MRFAAALSVSAALVFVLLELTVRVYLFGLAGFDPRRIESLRDFRETEFVRESQNPALGFEHAPNVEGYFKLVPYRTNSAGMRDREYTFEKPEGTFRVVVVGSSFTVPAGVRIEDAYHSLLEDRLTAERAPLRYEFLNMAIGAHHPRQTLAMLRYRGLRYHPDLILFGVTSLSMPLLTASAVLPDDGHHPILRPPSHPFFASFLVKLVELRTGRLDPEIQNIPGPGNTSPPSILEVLGEIQRETGIPIVLIRLEFDPERKDDGEARVIAAARAQGLHYFDTRESFVGMNPKDLWIHELDPHPNAVAQRVFADAIGRYLTQQGLLEPRSDRS